jgi:AraC-like DNA-binding protein
MDQHGLARQAARADSFLHWRELICEAFLSLTPESDRRDGFTGAVTQWQFTDLSLARIRSQRQRVSRTERDIDRAPRYGYYANFQVQGVSRMTQQSRSTVLRPGDLAVVDTAEPFAFDFPEPFVQLSLYLPGPLLESQLGRGVPTATRVDTGAGVGAAVRHALGALSRGDLAPEAAARLAVHTCGLIAVALERPVTADTPALRHDRLHRAALEDIDEHLTDDDLSAPVTAHRLGVSARLLYAVFAGQRHSYATEVRRRRLDRAWRELQDPARSHLRVIDVAVSAGFADVTSFHRAFRRVYGRTPRQVREAAMGPAGGSG